MPQAIPIEGSTRAPDGRRLGLVLGLLVLPMYVALGAPSVALPVIGRALAVPFGATAWILAAWSLTSALAMPIGPAAVAGLSDLGPGSAALAGLAALPLAGLAVALTRRPGARRPPTPDDARGTETRHGR